MTWEPSIYQSDQHSNNTLFHSRYEHRISAWRQLRLSTGNDEQFIKTVLNVYSKCPLTNTTTDYYKTDTWPTAWQLLEKNDYDFFDKCLAVCYTLKLSERFNIKNISIIKVHNKEEKANNNLKFNFIIKLGTMYIDCHNVDYFDEKEFDKKYIQQYNQQLQ